jgi:outer membrane lipoprotein-sorting protein
MKIAALALILLTFVTTADAQTFTLEQVLAKMDAAGRTFQTMEAAIERTHVTVLVNDQVTDSGKIYFARKGTAPRIKIEFTKPTESFMLIDDGKYQAYLPKLKQIQEKFLGENQDKAEFMLIGFGQSNANLQKTYDVTLLPEETINGVKTSVLELKPKSAQVAAMFTTIRLWMDQQRWIPIQTRVTEASKNYQVIKFSDIKLNGRIPDTRFSLGNLPKDVQTIKL